MPGPYDGHKTYAALTAALLLPLCTTSPAQELSASAAEICAGERLEFERPPLRVFDADGDRLISREEAAGCETLAFLFSRLDLDASGSLTASEYDGFPELWRRRARTFGDPE